MLLIDFLFFVLLDASPQNATTDAKTLTQQSLEWYQVRAEPIAVFVETRIIFNLICNLFYLRIEHKERVLFSFAFFCMPSSGQKAVRWWYNEIQYYNYNSPRFHPATSKFL